MSSSFGVASRALLLLCWIAPVHAQDFSTDRCYENDIINRRCLIDVQERATARVDSLYTRLLEDLEQEQRTTRTELAKHAEEGDGADVDSLHLHYLDRRIKGLQNAQKAWGAHRDATCNEWLYAYWGGSLARPVMIRCRIDLTNARLQHLRDVYLQQP